MLAHELLKVEVGYLLLLACLEKLAKLGIRVDLATIVLVLEVVRANILGNLTSYISASHLGAMSYAKEISKLGGDLSRLYETRRSTGALVLVALSVDLVHGASLAKDLLLNNLEVSLKLSKLLGESLNGGSERSEGSREGRLNAYNLLNNSVGLGGRGCSRLGSRSSCLLYGCLLGLGCGGCLGSLFYCCLVGAIVSYNYNHI